MFVRNVSMRITPERATDFSRKIQDEIIPTLRKQNGFQDEILLVRPGKPEAVAISFWDTRENAEAYGRATYPEVLKTLGKLVDGTPKVETFEVAHSTLHTPAGA